MFLLCLSLSYLGIKLIPTFLLLPFCPMHASPGIEDEFLLPFAAAHSSLALACLPASGSLWSLLLSTLNWLQRMGSWAKAAILCRILATVFNISIYQVNFYTVLYIKHTIILNLVLVFNATRGAGVDSSASYNLVVVVQHPFDRL